ncbi:MAG: YesL family protein [Bacillota bacterium]
MKNLGDWYIRIGEWGLNLFLLNILWILFTLLGLFVVGIFPATAALFAVMRKLTMESKDISVFKLFWNTFRTEFFKANLLGYIFLFIGFILYVDLRVVQQLDNNILHQALTIALYILIFVYFLTLLYVFPIFVHFNMKTKEYLKHAIILAIARPIQSIFMVIGFIIVLFLLWRIPGLIPVFGVSLISFILMKIASISFPKIESTTTVRQDC